jgi:hypothetical protein
VKKTIEGSPAQLRRELGVRIDSTRHRRLYGLEPKSPAPEEMTAAGRRMALAQPRRELGVHVERVLLHGCRPIGAPGKGCNHSEWEHRWR